MRLILLKIRYPGLLCGQGTAGIAQGIERGYGEAGGGGGGGRAHRYSSPLNYTLDMCAPPLQFKFSSPSQQTIEAIPPVTYILFRLGMLRNVPGAILVMPEFVATLHAMNKTCTNSIRRRGKAFTASSSITSTQHLHSSASGISTTSTCAQCLHSSASGISTTSTHLHSFASGISTTSTHLHSSASGISTTSTHLHSFASGTSTTSTCAQCLHSSASGISTTSTHLHSFASGISTTSTHLHSSASGISTTSTHLHSFASGISTTCTHLHSSASGMTPILPLGNTALRPNLCTVSGSRILTALEGTEARSHWADAVKADAC